MARGGYDRTKLLAKAERARRSRRAKRAIALYRQVLAHEPDNADLHRRMAPLLVRRGLLDEAWRAYAAAADLLARRGFEAQASGLLREAADRMPRRPEVWLALADRVSQRGRLADALAVLLDGRRHFRGRRRREHAIALLRRAHTLDPEHLPVGIDLARQLARAGRRAEARPVLMRLAASHPTRQPRLRFELLRLAPEPGALKDWLLALAGRPLPVPRPARVEAATRPRGGRPPAVRRPASRGAVR